MLTTNNQFAALDAGTNDTVAASRSAEPLEIGKVRSTTFEEAEEANPEHNQQVFPGQSSHVKVNAISGMKHSLRS